MGPSTKIGYHDFVPGLVCSTRLPCMNEYMQRNRCTKWPSQKSLEYIASIPGILVPKGNPNSPNCNNGWRYSFSPQELHLAQDMPGWVKAGYRAYKYTYKSSYQNNISADRGPGTRTKDGRKHISSYHLKTVLLWSLEQESTWQEEFSFRMMILLLMNLADHLTMGVLPHYFNTDCDLFGNISQEELDSARSCVKDIRYDPVQSMINAPSDTRRIESCGVNLGKLHREYKNALKHIKVW